MKNYIKNLISILAVASVLIVGANSVYANSFVSTNLPSGTSIDEINSTGLTFTFNAGDTYYEYVSTTPISTSDTSTDNYTFSSSYVLPYGISPTVDANYYYLIMLCDTTTGSCPDSGTPNTVLTSSGYVGSSDNFFVADTTPPPPVLGLTFFGGKSSGTGAGVMDAPTFLSQTATALDATASGIYPILAIVAGLILTFIVIKKIIGLYKQTGGQSKKIK